MCPRSNVSTNMRVIPWVWGNFCVIPEVRNYMYMYCMSHISINHNK